MPWKCTHWERMVLLCTCSYATTMTRSNCYQKKLVVKWDLLLEGVLVTLPLSTSCHCAFALSVVRWLQLKPIGSCQQEVRCVCAQACAGG